MCISIFNLLKSYLFEDKKNFQILPDAYAISLIRVKK